MQRHTLKVKQKNTKKRVGRGLTRGTTSGRGTKGQRARAGARIRPQFRDELKKIPKLRGHTKNRVKSVRSRIVPSTTISLSDMNTIQSKNISPQVLLKGGVIKKCKGRVPLVKILANGDIQRAITVRNCEVSIRAQEKIKGSGGTIHF